MKWLKEVAASGHCRPEDVAWLSSRSDSELEMLISIKETVIHRAKAVGCEEWGVKFDLKMLRAIDLVLRECLKERLINSPVISKSAASAICPDELAVSGAECHVDVNSLVEKEVIDWKYSTLRQKKKLERCYVPRYGQSITRAEGAERCLSALARSAVSVISGAFASREVSQGSVVSTEASTDRSVPSEHERLQADHQGSDEPVSEPRPGSVHFEAEFSHSSDLLEQLRAESRQVQE